MRFSVCLQAFLLPKTQQKPNSSGKTSASSVDYSISYIIYTLYIWSIWSIPYFTHDNARYRTVYNNMKSETLTIGVVKPWSILTKLWSTLPAHLHRLHGVAWANSAKLSYGLCVTLYALRPLRVWLLPMIIHRHQRPAERAAGPFLDESETFY